MEGRYLDLLERCLLDDIYGSHDLASGRATTEEEVNQGLIWPARAHTMLGRARLRNIRDCLHEVLEKGIEGDVIETGVWRGGAVIYMKGILVARSSSKKVYVADSFCGLPPPDARYPADQGDPHHTYNALAVARSTVEENFRRYGLMDDSVRFVEGFFEHSLPTAGIDKLSLLRLDGDMYSSTIQALNALYDKVQKGGYVIVDDYALSGCRQAVDDFRRDRGISEPLVQIDWTGHFWQKQ
jgi:O-methyltransferase